MRYRLILWLFMVSGAAASAAAQTASAVVRATVRPGRCPVHSKCGDHPDRGSRPASIALAEIAALALTIDTAAGTQPPHITIHPLRDLREMGLAVSWTISVGAEQHRFQLATRSSVDLPRQLSSATMRALEPGLITVIVEY